SWRRPGIGPFHKRERYLNIDDRRAEAGSAPSALAAAGLAAGRREWLAVDEDVRRPADHHAPAAGAAADDRRGLAVDEDIRRAFDPRAAVRGVVTLTRRGHAADRYASTAAGDDARGP